jgi:serine/threonine-protein kinase
MMTTSDTDVTHKVSEDHIETVAAQAPVRRTESGRKTPRQRGLGLAAQFFVLAAALLSLTLGLTVAVAAWRSGQVAEQTIREDLARVPDVWEGYALSRSSAALEQVQSLAREPGTLAIFADEVDLSTRLSFATEDAPQMLQEASTIFLFDRYSGVLARSDRPDGSGIGQPFASVGWVASVLDTWQGTTAFLRERDQLAMVAAAPVIAGEGDGAQLQGVLAVTFPIGTEALAQLQTLTRGEIAIVADMAGRNEPPQPGLAASTPGIDGAALVAALVDDSVATDSVFLAGEVFGPVTIGADAEAREVLAVPIFNSTGDSLAALLVARSRAEEMASFFAIRRGLIIAGVVMLLLSLPISYLLGRRIAKPLQKLARGAELIRDGRLDVDLPEAGSGEVGVLAGAFAAMVEELREKDALEQLVADMRSSSADTDGGATQAAPPPSAIARDARLPATGEVFGERYKIRSELGRGGMGVVFRASDLELEEDVALKVMRPETFADATDGVAKLKQEVRLARRISHPNVIRVHDLVEAGGLRCLSMEFVPGTTLLAVLRQHGGLRLAPGLQVAKQLCRGLTAVHSEGIVHRDLKPQNVMVLPNGVVKLMDFGVSSGLQSAGTNKEGMVVGTPAYMSPEQCRGQELDFRSDLYSLGIVLWEMFAGKIPFSGTTVASLIQQQLNTVAPPLRGARDDVPPELERVVMSCLAKDPDQRPASASLVYQSLRDVLVTDW